MTRQASLLANTALPATTAALCPVLLRPAPTANTRSVAKQHVMIVLKATNAPVVVQKPPKSVQLAPMPKLVRPAAALPAQMAKVAISYTTPLLTRALQALISKLDQKMD